MTTATGTLPGVLDQLAGSPGTLTVGAPPDGVRLGYAELAERADDAARGFHRQGVRHGDRVLVRIGTGVDEVVALLGLFRLGAVPVSLKPEVPGFAEEAYLRTAARQQDARYVCGFALAGTRTVTVTGPGEPGTARAGAPWAGQRSDSDAVAFVQYTSGSTASPRPVPLSHRALLANTAAIAEVCGMGPDSVGLVALPLHHDMGLIGMLSCLVNGTSVVLFETAAFLRAPVPCLNWAAECGATDTAMPDFLLRYLARRLSGGTAARHGTGLLAAYRTVFCGAEPIRRTTVSRFLDAAGPLGLRPPALTFSYGLAESTLLATAHRYTDDAGSFDGPGPAAPACLGRPVPGVDLRVEDPRGAGPAGPAAPGRVLLRGDCLFNGYDGVTDHRETWFDTGDLGYLRGGELHLCGRIADRVVVNGANVFVSDIESHLLHTQAVSDCVVLPCGEGFTVLVVGSHDRDVDTMAVAAEVTALVGIAPDSVHRVGREAITRTASGKPARFLMTEQLEKGLLP